MLKRQVSLLNVYFRNRKQTSSIALHCFWASFSRQSNEPRIPHSLIASALTFELGLWFYSFFFCDSIFDRYSISLWSKIGLWRANRKWRFLHLKSLMTWMMHGEGGGSRLRNFSWCSFGILTWLIVPLIHPHPHGPMMIRVLCKNIGLINLRCGVFQSLLAQFCVLLVWVDVWHIQKEDTTGLLRWEMGWQVT